jgi:hypothetical protein
VPGGQRDGTALPGLVAERHDLQTLFASESLGPALRQLAVYGRDGLPVVSADERQLDARPGSATAIAKATFRPAEVLLNYPERKVASPPPPG